MDPPAASGHVDADTVSRILEGVAADDPSAADQLLPLVYDQLRAIAQQRMSQERHDHTMQATALVHEAYLRLVGEEKSNWAGRAQFYAAAAEAMRRILIEHARARGRIKRGGDGQGRPAQRVPLTVGSVADLAADADPEQILALDGAIRRVEERDARMGEIVRLRFYAGLSIEQTAAALGVSPRTVKRDWTFVRAWLFKDLREAEAAGEH